MSLERVVQPLVACLGNPVAGNPTQFVMSRIARDAGVDWRFFTSEVEPEQFEPAFRGVQALGMAGAALSEPFQNRALSLLESATEPALILGRVNVVRCDGTAWIGDHTLGQAAMQLLRCRFSRFRTMGDSELEPHAIAVCGSIPMARSIRSSLGALSGDVTLFACGDRPIVASIETSPPTQALIDYRTWDEMDQLERPVRGLIVTDVSAFLSGRPASVIRRLQQIGWASDGVCVFTERIPSSLRLELGAWFNERGIQLTDEVELMVHQSAIDFHFWTGHEPNLDLIRESLEEYLQW